MFALCTLTNKDANKDAVLYGYPRPNNKDISETDHIGGTRHTPHVLSSFYFELQSSVTM